MKPRQLTWKWLLLALVAIVIAGLLLLPREFEPPSVVRDRIAAVLSEWTGATVTLTEPLSVRYYPPLSLRGGLVLTNATKLPSVSAITARDVKISLDPLELLMGRIKIDGLRLAEPNITLKENAASAALIAGALADVPVGAVRIRRGTIKTASGESLVRDLDVRLAASGGGALTAMGSLDFRGETVAFAVDSGALSDTEGKPSAPVTISVTSKPMTDSSWTGTSRPRWRTHAGSRIGSGSPSPKVRASRAFRRRGRPIGAAPR
jgi:AsmA protein